jgi:hypothetical protein
MDIVLSGLAMLVLSPLLIPVCIGLLLTGEHYVFYFQERIGFKNKKFDIIVAGDLIEHLFNPGRFLEGMKPFFHENTELILTTPNCFSTSYMLPYIFSGFEIVREDHTCWYSEKTLKQLILMSGYAVKEFHYRSEKIINGIRPFFRVSLRKLFPRFCEGLIFVVKLRK